MFGRSDLPVKDGVIIVSEGYRAQQLFWELLEHSESVSFVRFSSTEDKLLSASEDLEAIGRGKTMVSDGNTLELPDVFMRLHPDADMVTVIYLGDSMEIWSAGDFPSQGPLSAENVQEIMAELDF